MLDGRPFCPQCRAPQIHVPVTVSDSESAAGAELATGKYSPAILLDPALSALRPIAAGTISQSIAVRAALKAGVFGFFLSIIPFLGIVATGALAVFFYRRESRIVLPVGLGSRLGAAAGIVAVVISSVLFGIRYVLFHGRQEYLDFLAQVARTAGINPADPEGQAVMHYLSTPSGMATAFFLGLIFAAVLASAGGALASLFLRSRNPRV